MLNLHASSFCFTTSMNIFCIYTYKILLRTAILRIIGNEGRRSMRLSDGAGASDKVVLGVEVEVRSGAL